MHVKLFPLFGAIVGKANTYTPVLDIEDVAVYCPTPELLTFAPLFQIYPATHGLTLFKPTIEGVMPETVPVNVGDARFAFKFNADNVAVDTGLLASDVSSTLPKPTDTLVRLPLVK